MPTMDLFTESVPIPQTPHGRPPLPRNSMRAPMEYAGERPQDRTLMLVLSLVAMTTMTVLLGSRFSQLKKRAISKRNFTCMLVLSLYVLVMGFFLGLLILHTGQGLYTYQLCFALTWVCLVFYAMAKSVIYIFLVERVHIVRAPYAPTRSGDYIYLGCMAVMFAACGAVVINAFLNPVTNMSPDDGRCHNGIGKRVTIPFLIIDIIMDVILTGVFVYLLHPFVRGGWSQTLSVGMSIRSSSDSGGAGQGSKASAERGGGGSRGESRGESAVQRGIRTLLRRTIAGAFAITVVTLGLFVAQYLAGNGGKGVALICSSLCLGDVFWGYLVIHYLTFSSLETEENMSSTPYRNDEGDSDTLVNQDRHAIHCQHCAPKPPQQQLPYHLPPLRHLRTLSEDSVLGRPPLRCLDGVRDSRRSEWAVV
ncbi:unnamed protein product [Periconia digitata]|uniref:Uncharacterized protein n=1 Tax=Periconia digitata TaxID=1303443 RepID=A0A9W4UPT2_9PLEO|nr:unnamed protein product [Periconia digitata]